jgi:branched-chain amino acid transport system permease protein
MMAGSLIALISLLLIFPLFSPPGGLYLLDLAEIYAILAMSLAFTVGYAGLLSLAHAVFFGVGAYFTGLSMIAGWPFLPTFFLAGFIASFLGVVIGFPALRTRGVYFSITTLCLTIIAEMVLNNWESLTRGSSGLGGIPKPDNIFGSTGFFLVKINSASSYHYLISVVTVLTGFILYRITRSEIGRTMIAIRDEKKLSSVIGINTLKYELINFCIGAFFAGLAGSLYAVFIRYLHPTDFGILQCFDILAMVVVGGVNSISGAIMGSLFINFFPELIGIAPALKRIVYGIVIIAVVIFMPYGLQGLFSQIVNQVKSRIGFKKEQKKAIP